MNTDYRGKPPRRSNNVLQSFSFAISGLKSAVKSERNLQIHLTISVIIICLGILFSISRVEWILVILTIGGMLSLELLNTAVERVVDLVTEEYHPLAKQAKDIAAGAVFTYAIIAVLVGLFIFLPKLFSLMQ